MRRITDHRFEENSFNESIQGLVRNAPWWMISIALHGVVLFALWTIPFKITVTETSVNLQAVPTPKIEELAVSSSHFREGLPPQRILLDPHDFTRRRELLDGDRLSVFGERRRGKTQPIVGEGRMPESILAVGDRSEIEIERIRRGSD